MEIVLYNKGKDKLRRKLVITQGKPKFIVELNEEH